MARIVLADDGIRFDGRTPEQGPLGGAESAFILPGGSPGRARSRSTGPQSMRRARNPIVAWNGCRLNPDRCRKVRIFISPIASDKLIPRMPGARRTVFWVHNPAQYVLKWRYLWKLWRYRPTIVFIGDYHATTYPKWAPDGGRVVIPYGIPEPFRTAEAADVPPPPRAIFTSNPLRSLDWLLELWVRDIRPKVPGAELHVFSGRRNLWPGWRWQGFGDGTDPGTGPRSGSGRGGCAARSRGQGGADSRIARFAYDALSLGDLNETFCLAVGEAQAMGVPTVVRDLGSVVERVVDGETGFVARDDTAFAESAVRLLRDDDLWRAQHNAALATQRCWGWADAAARF